ncbi:MAG: hypothetical protein MK132_20145 [Lentisphaerales bacterium]|nr:hypothetical protein [Lentisphaerales bacterium]
MFGNGLFGGSRLKLMSAFTTGLIASTSLYSADKQTKIAEEIKQEIRPNGLTYAVSVNESFDATAGMVKVFEEYGIADLKKAMEGLDIWQKLSAKLGIDEIDGSGFSIVKEGDRYLADAFMHLKEEHEKSLIWQMLGEKSSKLEALEMLPEETVLAGTFRLDLKQIWHFVKNDLKAIMPEEDNSRQQLEAFIQQAEQRALALGAPIEDFAAALSTEVTLFVTMDKAKEMYLPGAPKLPGLSVSLMLKKQSDLLQNLILGFSQVMQPQQSKIADFDVLAMPDPLPTGTQAGFAHNKDWLVLTSDISDVQKISAAKSGKSLLKSKKFAAYKSMAKEGNNAFFMSGDIYDELKMNLQAMPDEMKTAAASFDYMIFQGNRPEFFYLGSKKPNGFKAEFNSTFNLPQGQMLSSVAVIGVLAAMILPALGKARMKARMAHSKSNLKSLGQYVAMYFTEGLNDKFPEDLSKLEIDTVIFTHPKSNRAATLEQAIIGQADYVILFKSGDTFRGAKNIPLAMDRPGIWDDGSVNVVFQDGSVRVHYGNTVEEVMNDIRLNN